MYRSHALRLASIVVALVLYVGMAWIVLGQASQMLIA
jgi:hypothetical protein